MLPAAWHVLIAGIPAAKRSFAVPFTTTWHTAVTFWSVFTRISVSPTATGVITPFGSTFAINALSEVHTSSPPLPCGLNVQVSAWVPPSIAIVRVLSLKVIFCAGVVTVTWQVPFVPLSVVRVTSAAPAPTGVTLPFPSTVATEELEELKEKYNGVSLEIQSIEQKVRNSQQLLSYSSFYKNKGQYEIYESCKRQLEVLQGEIDSYVSKIAIIDEKINEKKSKERSKDIREDIEGYCRTLADAINLPKTFIKLRDFVQIIDRTGSETPRLVYMYQSALYLYNLYRTNSPFNFYVVDTPNQQGQDAENLGSIFKSLELFLSDAGQVIVGTERETGLEGKASNVIKLTEKRRCLNTINYSKHLELLEELQKTAISWVAFNHKAKNEK